MALIFKTFDAVKKLFSSFYYNTFYMIHVIKGKQVHGVAKESDIA